MNSPVSTSPQTSAAFRDLIAQGQTPVILQVLPALNSGGVEQGVIDMNAAIVKAGGVSIVVSSGGQRVYDITRAGGVHFDMPVNSKNPFTIMSNARKLRKLIRKQNVSLVHAASRAPAWVAQKAVKGTNARYLTSCHAAHKVGGRFKRMYNAAIAGGEIVIAVSEYLSRYLQHFYGTDPAKIRVIHRGVALEKFHPTAVSAHRMIAVAQQMRVPDGAPVVLLPGRLSRIKGHMFLLDALNMLNRRDVFVVLMGGDHGQEKYRMELEQYIKTAGLDAQCRIVTDCNDIPAAYMIANVVACPSQVPEGFGRTAVEAQAMGRPVIATDLGGTQETVIPGETGWLVPLADTQALSRALDEALSLDGEARARMATAAMNNVAQHFTNDRMCAATLDVYAALIASPRAGAKAVAEAA